LLNPSPGVIDVTAEEAPMPHPPEIELPDVLPCFAPGDQMAFDLMIMQVVSMTNSFRGFVGAVHGAADAFGGSRSGGGQVFAGGSTVNSPNFYPSFADNLCV
jgi:hypothetical protein